LFVSAEEKMINIEKLQKIKLEGEQRPLF